MPIYEYQCDSCGANFDAIQKFSDAPLTTCRQCGAEGVRKLLSAPSFRLKGGGWYETDFKNNNQRNVVKKEGDSGSAASGADSGNASSKGEGASKDGGSTKASSGSDSGKKGGGGGSGSATAA